MPDVLDQALRHYAIAASNHESGFHSEKAAELLAGLNPQNLSQNSRDIYNAIKDGLRKRCYEN
jgi:hypothetical protein